MKILISGDFFLSQSIDLKELLTNKIVNLFKSSDLNVINLESPVTVEDKKNKIIKVGPHLNGNQNSFSVLQKLNTTLVTLANNHILDYGSKGIQDTISKCKENSIDFVGAGMTLHEAKEPYFFHFGNLKLAIINFAENEFASAEIDKPGANPMDLIDNVTQIRNVKKEVDFLFVIVHGGHEYFQLPSPRMVKQYRFLVENGADAIIGHHPHCIGGYEIYNGVPIFYSLGNMLFAQPSRREVWYTGLTLKLEIKKGIPIKWELLPTRMTKNNYQLSILSGIEKEKVLYEVEKLSKIIKDDKLLLQKWKSFAEENKGYTLNNYSPINILQGYYIKSGLRKLGFNNFLLPKRFIKRILNQTRCEAHRDLSIEVLKTKINNG
jgi:poly-gamma-glutamate synthesis protein (capsule biosynthesis protein)